MKIFIGLLLTCIPTVFLSCGGVPLLNAPSDNNETYRVDYLFEHDGCKVYRFYDNGKYVYFTNCNGSVTSSVSDSTNTQIQNTVRITVTPKE